jgi:predicted phosphodiesterase
MRVAVLNDIHGNLPAFEAVLDKVLGVGVDRIVVGGDVFPGPMAHLVLRRLATCGLPVDCIYGNGEVAILEHLAGRIPAQVPEAYRPMVRWNAEQLTAEEARTIRGWPLTLRLNVPTIGEVLFCHATPRGENEIFTKLTAEERLIPVFSQTNAAVVVCGHTHMQFDRMIGATRVVNSGSVGMPFGTPGADWLLIGPGLELRHTYYDLDGAAGRIRASGYPAADEFAAKYVLQPPSAEEMVKVLSTRGL